MSREIPIPSFTYSNIVLFAVDNFGDKQRVIPGSAFLVRVGGVIQVCCKVQKHSGFVA
jgi:hypothetical protein